jgi:hypothetical protein
VHLHGNHWLLCASSLKGPRLGQEKVGGGLLIEVEMGQNQVVFER